ncbi:hypothetical protein [Streptomyces cadmiisoli]|uniref:ATP-binding protein n=1 Tax=Streptomyces cadmiisoli TaxID=2184053 RepID=A0A2Z4IZC4_9ACTN|nr:hypothetical protein [Streptomyces cadmiisoli]AWW37938.1 hypothetical protein DN051_15860 [Streptomyces cadmiisoli]
MARHVSARQSNARRVLIALATAGAALGAGATTSAAAEPQPVALGEFAPRTAVRTLTDQVPHVTGTVAGVKPNPLAGTNADPLDNGVDTQVGDFKAVKTRDLTRPVTQAPSVGEMPVVGQVTGSAQQG